MDISVIIVSWNAKKYLLDCLHSIVPELSNVQAEIIVVDNASSDGSPELVEKQFPKINLICNKENLGFAKANNIALEKSTGKYICLINSDVVIKEKCFDVLISYMDSHPDVGMMGPQILDTTGNIQRSCMQLPTLWNTFCTAIVLDKLFPQCRLFGGKEMTYWNHDSLQEVDVINGCFWIIRREALDQVGYLDGNFFMYGEDIDWCKRFQEKGWKIIFSPEAQAIHYGGASSSNDPVRFYIEMNRANLQYYRKHYKKFSQIGFLMLIMLHHVVRIFFNSIYYFIKPHAREEKFFKLKRSLLVIKKMAFK